MREHSAAPAHSAPARRAFLLTLAFLAAVTVLALLTPRHASGPPAQPPVPAPAPTPRPSPPPTETPQPPPLSPAEYDRLTRVIDDYLAGEDCRLSLALHDLASGATYSYRAGETYTTASLVKLNILKTQSKDVYKQTDKIITGSSESLTLALRSMNRQMIDLAREAIDKVKPAERNISGVTVGVDAKALKRISDEVDRCRRQAITIAGECDTADQVYRLNLQLFPLTEKL